MNIQSQATNDASGAVQWWGIHHIALVTRDLDATIRFYRDILGMKTGEIMNRNGKHCFIQPGGDTWGLHFFEYTDAQMFTQAELLSDRYVFLPGALQHLAFALADEDAGQALRIRLQQHGVEMSPINDLGRIRNFLFFDNNGILLEAAWPG